MAAKLLRDQGIPFEEIDVTGDSEKRSWLVEATGRRTIPQIFIDGRPIGGFSELVDLHRQGELAALRSGDGAERAYSDGEG